MLLYHGSNLTVDKPRLVEQVRGLDFGRGFYLTTSETQAIRFSENIVRRRSKGVATVNIYEFNAEEADRILNIRRFAGANRDWLWFVADNRLKTYRGGDYDMVVGAVANDTVMPTLQAFLNGFINEEATLITLKTSNLVGQICLKSPKALSLLWFVKSFTTRAV